MTTVAGCRRCCCLLLLSSVLTMTAAAALVLQNVCLKGASQRVVTVRELEAEIEVGDLLCLLCSCVWTKCKHGPLCDGLSAIQTLLVCYKWGNQ